MPSGSAPWSALTTPRLLAAGAFEFNRCAVVTDSGSRTYGELRERAGLVAVALVGLGIEPGERVAIVTGNRLEYIEIECGIAAAGAIAVPIDWRMHSLELADCLRRSGARAAFVEDHVLGRLSALRHAGRVPQLRTLIAVDGDAGDLGYDELCASAISPKCPLHPRRLEDAREIVFDPGRAGPPKALTHSFGGLLFHALQQALDFRIGAESSTYTNSDLSGRRGGLDLTWAILQAGGEIHLSRSPLLDARDLLAYLAEHSITHVTWTASMLQTVVGAIPAADHDLSALQVIICRGRASQEVAESAQRLLPHVALIQAHGLAEVGGAVLFVPPDAIRVKAGSVGRPSTHVSIRIVDAAGDDVPLGSHGDILVRAPSVTLGYWDSPERTAAVLADGWLRTGEIGRQDLDGYVYLA